MMEKLVREDGVCKGNQESTICERIQPEKQDRGMEREREREREKDNRPWRHDATHYPFSRNGNEREKGDSRHPVHEVPRLVFVWGVFKLLDFPKLEV